MSAARPARGVERSRGTDAPAARIRGACAVLGSCRIPLMNLAALAVFATTAGAAKPEAGPVRKSDAADTGDTLRFLNGDVLHGRLVAVGPEFITWQHLETRRLIEFRTSGLADVQFEPRAPGRLASPFSSGSVRVGLANGDEIPGSIVSLNGEKLELQTGYAGKITIPRKMLRLVAPARVSATAVYEGPKSMQGWRAANADDKVWDLKKNALVAHAAGMIGRDIELPGLASVEFDLGWKGQLAFALGLYCTSLNENDSDGYAIMLGEGTADLLKSRHGNSEQVGGNAEVPSLAQMDRVHVKIYVNHNRHTFTLLLDGVNVRQWTDRAGFHPHGKLMLLASQGETIVKVSNLRVAAWNGRPEAQEMEGAAAGEDVMRLSNGDRMSGKLEKIDNGRAAFYTAHGTLAVPLQKIEDLILPGRVAHDAGKHGEARAFLGGTSRVTMAVEKWDAKQVVASGPGFGRATFATASIQRLEFHARPAARDSDEEYDGASAVETAQ